MDDFWWVNLIDEELVQVHIRDVKPGHQETFRSARDSALKRLNPAKSYFELERNQKKESTTKKEKP